MVSIIFVIEYIIFLGKFNFLYVFVDFFFLNVVNGEILDLYVLWYWFSVIFGFCVFFFFLLIDIEFGFGLE